MIVSYHNDPKLKKDMVSEMKKHYEMDAFIKGTYGHMNGQFKGCAVGCGVNSLNVRRGLKIKTDDHAEYAKALGIPEWLARMEDTLFENLPEKESKEFPLAFVKAIPIGVDLEPVKWKFCAFLLKENIERVLSLKIDDKLKKRVIRSIQGILKLHEDALETGKWDESAARSTARSAWSAARSARSAASAAESAARSTARSAAWSVESAARSTARSVESAAWSVESAAWSAAESVESAAWSAASAAEYIKYSKELLRLIKAQKP